VLYGNNLGRNIHIPYSDKNEIYSKDGNKINSNDLFEKLKKNSINESNNHDLKTDVNEEKAIRNQFINNKIKTNNDQEKPNRFTVFMSNKINN
jgi:hypothetical protein